MWDWLRLRSVCGIDIRQGSADDGIRIREQPPKFLAGGVNVDRTQLSFPGFRSEGRATFEVPVTDPGFHGAPASPALLDRSYVAENG